jgi:hypothetical protein
MHKRELTQCKPKSVRIYSPTHIHTYAQTVDSQMLRVQEVFVLCMHVKNAS